MSNRKTQRKVIYCIQRPLCQRDYERYGIGFMVARGHKVIVLDVGDIVLPIIPKNREDHGNRPEISISVIRCNAELKKHRQTMASADLIICLAQSNGPSLWNLAVLREIGASGAPYLILSCNAYPGFDLNQTTGRSFWTKLGEAVRNIRRVNLINSLIARLPRRLLGIPAADFVVYGGSKSQKSNPLVNSHTQPIFAHSLDYDLYMKIIATPPQQNQTAVFIDQDLPNHVDFVELKTNNTINAANYYGQLINLFDKIESECSLRVVVAAHPRRKESGAEKLFGGREIVFGETPRLIAASKLVIAHTSTALAMAALFYKPILVVAARDHYYSRPDVAYYYKSYATAFLTDVIFLDNTDYLNMNSILNADTSCYDGFVRDYVKVDNTPKYPFWQIVINEVARKGISL